METIRAYVENVFHTLPDTEEIKRTKEEILNNMLDKYHELKQNGRSEHEAVGIVISEFGNIDELLEEMNLITPDGKSMESVVENEANSKLRPMSLSEVKNYITDYVKAGRAIAFGVVLCIIGVTLLILVDQLSDDGILIIKFLTYSSDTLGVAGLFLCVAAAVAIFIINGMRLSKYSYVEQGIRMDTATREYVEASKTAIQPSFTRNLVIGISLCVISPLVIIISDALFPEDSSYPVVLFFLFIAAGVYILVSSGVRFGCLTTLLSGATKTASEKKSDSITGSICGVIMLIATAIYLFFGFVQGKWETAPVIYAIGGILCGITAIIVSGIQDAKNH